MAVAAERCLEQHTAHPCLLPGHARRWLGMLILGWASVPRGFSGFSLAAAGNLQPRMASSTSVTVSATVAVC